MNRFVFLLLVSSVSGKQDVLGFVPIGGSFDDTVKSIGDLFATTNTKKSAISSKTPSPKTKLTPAQRILQKDSKPVESIDDFGTTSVSGYDQVKDLLYNVGDNLANIGKIASSNKTPESKESKIFDGYSAKVTSSTAKKNPTKQILPQIKPKPKTIEPKLKSSVFDGLKEVVYGTADLATKTKKTVTTPAKPPSPIQRLQGLDTAQQQPPPPPLPFKPVTKAQPLQASQKFRDAIPDLESNNPFRRIAAEWKLKNMEFQENAKNTQKQITNTIESVKDGAYKFADAIQTTTNEIKKIPDKTKKTADDVATFFKAIPVAVEETVDTVTSIPSKIEEKANNVQRSVDETVTKTKRVVNDVKAIPSNIKKSVQTTQQSVTETVQKVEDVSYNTKVLLGLEKPRPKPPKSPPPKPPTPTDQVLKVAGNVAAGTGKAVWWITKNTAQFTWDAISNQISKNSKKQLPSSAEAEANGTTKKESKSVSPLDQIMSKVPLPKVEPKKQMMPKRPSDSKIRSTDREAIAVKMQSTASPSPPAKGASSPPPPPLPKENVEKTTNTISDDDLEKEVAEVLQMAKDALAEANKPIDASTNQKQSLPTEKENKKRVVEEKEETTKVTSSAAETKKE